MKTQVERDGIVTLAPDAARAASANTDLWNDDLRPCTRAEHNWSGSQFSALWIGMCLCIPTYSLAAGMISLGMNWWEATAAVFLGSAIVLLGAGFKNVAALSVLLVVLLVFPSGLFAGLKALAAKLRSQSAAR